MKYNNNDPENEHRGLNKAIIGASLVVLLACLSHEQIVHGQHHFEIAHTIIAIGALILLE